MLQNVTQAFQLWWIWLMYTMAKRTHIWHSEKQGAREFEKYKWCLVGMEVRHVHEKIRSLLTLETADYHLMWNILSSHLLYINTKTAKYIRILYVVLYGCEIRSVTLSKICNVKVFENRAVFVSQEEVMHIYSIYPAKRWGCFILQHLNNKDHLTFIHFGNIMLEKWFSNHQKYSPHNTSGIISLVVFQFKVREVNIQLALSHETSAAINTTTVMCVYKSWVTMLKRDSSECY